jgi:repressor LexA
LKKIHPTQKQLLELLKNNNNEPLTIRDLQDRLNLSSTSVVFHHLQQLEKKGLLKRNPNNPQDYQVVDAEENLIIYLNLYGLAECGPSGRILDGDPIDKIPVSSKMLDFSLDNAFLVKANGDSMVPKINNGDLIIAVKSNYADNNSVVVCVNKGVALVKQIVKENDSVILRSFNPEYKPFYADPATFHIEGIVKSILMRNL